MMGISTFSRTAEIGLNHSYVYARQNPVKYVDPTGEFGLLGFAFGALSDLGLQLAMNGGKWECIDWVDVGISGAISSVAPGLASTAKTARSSARAAETIQRQLARAKSGSRRQKLASRIHRHNDNFTNALAVQAGWQAVSHVAKGSDSNNECSCSQ